MTPDMLPSPPISSGNSLVHSILSYNSNIMLAAIISLLLVILFVLLLHAYAKWFLVQAAQRGGARGAVAPRVLGVRLHHHFQNFTVDTMFSTTPTKGLEASVISTIPQFLYRSGEKQQGLECVICLSVFEEGEVGRKLYQCEHLFHVECIDMWLHSHTTCPTCRGPAIGNTNDKVGEHGRGLSEVDLNELEIVVVEGTIDDNMSTDGRLSICSSSSVSSSQVPDSLGASLKRMMSRSKCVGKIEHAPEREEQGP